MYGWSVCCLCMMAVLVCSSKMRTDLSHMEIKSLAKCEMEDRKE